MSLSLGTFTTIQHPLDPQERPLRLVSGWRRGFAWFILALTIVSGLQGAFILMLGRTAVAALTGLEIQDPEVTVLWLLEQGATLTLAAGCAGLLQNSIRWAYVAMWGAFALAGLQGGEALVTLFTASTLVIPVTAMVYGAFAVGIDRSVEAYQKLMNKPHTAREGA
jgi:hypothetical protein